MLEDWKKMMESEIAVWIDPEFRDVAMQMALDEAVFLHAARSCEVTARFYHWNTSAVTVGYFHDFSKFPTDFGGTPVVRRMTGGGVVEHGSDLTFVLAFPKNSSVASLGGEERYATIHRALTDALVSAGIGAEMLATAPQGNGPCFATPVPQDIVIPGTDTKIAGGAQRKSRGDLIHQGSVRLDLPHSVPSAPWIADFLKNLATRVSPISSESRKWIESEASSLHLAKYGSENWNRLSENSRIK